MKRSVLYVGADDSNHAGTAKGEIVLATFSFNPEDALRQKFPNRRSYSAAKNWLGQKDHEYLFTILTDLESRKRNTNLPVAVPVLLNYYLINHRNIREIYLFLDGIISRTEKIHLEQQFKDYNLSVATFTKKVKMPNGEIRKGPFCPRLVYIADILANRKFKASFGSITTNERFVPMPKSSNGSLEVRTILEESF